MYDTSLNPKAKTYIKITSELLIRYNNTFLIWGLRDNKNEDYSLLGCDAV